MPCGSDRPRTCPIRSWSRRWNGWGGCAGRSAFSRRLAGGLGSGTRPPASRRLNELLLLVPRWQPARGPRHVEVVEFLLQRGEIGFHQLLQVGQRRRELLPRDGISLLLRAG